MKDHTDYIENCINKGIIPDDQCITLKDYCNFFESRIENHEIFVEMDDGMTFRVYCEAKAVSHILDIHEFYDKKSHNKQLKFEGAFNGINAYKNMKKSIITLDILKSSKNGRAWSNETTRIRVLSFPFIMKALTEGEWHYFDVNKFRGKTKLIPDFIASYHVQQYVLNICISKKNDSNYFCISNIIAFRNHNPRTNNQDIMPIRRIIEKDESGKIIESRCHSKTYKNQLMNVNVIDTVTVSKEKHDKIIKSKCFANSSAIEENRYLITYLSIDSNTRKLLK